LTIGGQDSPCIRVAIFQQKIIPQNADQDRTDGSSVKIPPVSQKRKTSEFRSEPFLGREKPLEIHSKPFLRREISEFRSEPFLGRENPLEFHSEPFLRREKPLEFCSEPFLDEKNLGILFRTIFGREKTSELCSESFSEEKKLRNSVPNHFPKRKKLPKKTTFVSCFLKLHCFAEFRFVPSYGMDSSEILRITQNEHFIPRNYENRGSGQNTSGRQDSPVMNTFGTLDS
jgi:hypothetical protein